MKIKLGKEKEEKYLIIVDNDKEESGKKERRQWK